MSEKEWEVSYNEYNNTYTVKEAKHYDFDSPPSTEPTGRENLNKKLRNMGKGGKIFLILFFNLYGSLFRFSSNRTLGFIYGLLDLMLGKFLFFHILTEIVRLVSVEAYDDVYSYLIILGIIILFWLIDLLSIINKNDIIFFGNKKYKNYSDYKRR